MRIVAASDTHFFHNNLKVPDGDIFIHAGDFSMRAELKHVIKFAKWVNSLPHHHKIVVAGNHDVACEKLGKSWCQDTFLPAIYLDHDYVELYGIRFFGSPYSSSIQEPSRWSFDYPREDHWSKKIWGNIPEVDVLITHGPPYGFGDKVNDPRVGENPHVGDLELLNSVIAIQPKIHIFGHIHEGYGTYSPNAINRGFHPLQRGFETVVNRTKFYNVSICTEQYKPSNPITVIDLN